MSDDRVRRLLERLESNRFIIRHEIRSLLYKHEVTIAAMHGGIVRVFMNSNEIMQTLMVMWLLI